jgi:hypothetical protein
MVNIIDEQLAAYNARDLERFVRCYADDYVMQDGFGNVVCAGPDGVRALFGAVFADSPALHCELVSRMQAGAWTVDQEHITGFVLEGFPEDANAVVAHYVADGKIDRSLALF